LPQEFPAHHSAFFVSSLCLLLARIKCLLSALFFVQAVSTHLTEDALGILLSLARFVNLGMKS